MAALIATGNSLENAYRHDKLRVNVASAHEDTDDEGFGQSYVCSMPSAIDLQVQDNGNCADLALNVQHYLSRIVEELHLISVWSSNLFPRQLEQRRDRHQQQNVSNTSALSHDMGTSNNSYTSMARLGVVTDIELLRRDVAKAQHELFQRCNTQIANLQNEVSVAVRNQDTLYNELLQLVNANVRAWGQNAQSIEALEKAQGENDVQIRTTSMTLRQVQQEAAAHPTRIAALEKCVATLTAAQFSHEQELQALQRQVESHDVAHNVQLEITQRTAEDSLAELRAANSQLSATMQVVRLEMQKHCEAQRRTQQLLKALGLVAGKSQGVRTPGIAPQRPSTATPRTARPLGGHAASSSQIRSGRSEVNSNSSGDFLGFGSCAPKSAGAASSPDCFIYAKAALPHRHSAVQISTASSKSSAQSIGSSRGTTGLASANANPAGSFETKTQDVMTSLLKVQQSVMSMPLGHEENTRSGIRPSSRESSTGVGEHTIPAGSSQDITRQSSLSCVNLSMEHRSHSTCELPISTKLRLTTSSARNL